MNNLLLAFITQEFRWLFSSLSLLNTPLLSKVFVRLCVIQFTRYSRRSALAVSLFILAWRFLKVKNFFPFFLLFSSRFCFPDAPRSDAPAYITKPPLTCQPLFSPFFAFCRKTADCARAVRGKRSYYLSSRKYGNPNAAGGRFSFFCLALVTISTMTVTT